MEKNPNHSTTGDIKVKKRVEVYCSIWNMWFEWEEIYSVVSVRVVRVLYHI